LISAVALENATALFVFAPNAMVPVKAANEKRIPNVEEPEERFHAWMQRFSRDSAG
jgi:hypothetical protein